MEMHYISDLLFLIMRDKDFVAIFQERNDMSVLKSVYTSFFCH